MGLKQSIFLFLMSLWLIRRFLSCTCLDNPCNSNQLPDPLGLEGQIRSMDLMEEVMKGMSLGEEQVFGRWVMAALRRTFQEE